jgi:NADPH-dependent glutamate synthase beta subunit-like oxidoreductase/NAD(P)H-flavin reductase
MKTTEFPRLKIDFQTLMTVAGLQALDHQFLSALQTIDPRWHEQLLAYRQNPQFAPPDTISRLLIDWAVALEEFLIQLFEIEEAAARLQAQTLSHQPIFAFKNYYVLKQARRAPAPTVAFFPLNQWIEQEITARQLTSDDPQLAVAHLGMLYLADADAYQPQIAQLIEWCVAAMTTEQGREAVGHWEMFRLPKRFNVDQLVDVQPAPNDPHGRLQSISLRYRDGFALTDSRMTQRQVMAEINYCVYCHKNQGDFCSRGFPVKKGDAAQGFKTHPLGDPLTGCPLEERISEMHLLKRDGFGIAALAMVMADNPMCPMTGHRICNDCMKACIYQKQEPVNIPQTETRVLTDVLDLPWGVEIYDLLTRWNPLRSAQWIAKPYNGLKVLVMGMGPAGFSLAHHLLMEGFAVVGMDGLKIEPLPDAYLREPIYRYSAITENLADRLVAGFGGVAEYGITVRWDKNFLKLIYISLARRRHFQVIGGVRFGGTLTVEEAWRLGFDHLAVAVGAGLPKELAIPNSLAPGMRQANDFLMALQLTGAAKADSLANLQIRLPAVVIGGGLTAIDTATEVQAYYLVQVEKMAYRYHTLVEQLGEKAVRSRFLPADLEILDEFLNHAEQLSVLRRQAEQEGRLPDLISLVRRWGGVTIAYRRTLRESPAYRHNHEELSKALEEGIYYAENIEPEAVILDADGQVLALRSGKQVLPARAILTATGARLNVAYEFEHRGTFLRRDRFEYQRYEYRDGRLEPVDTRGHVKSPSFGSFTSYLKDHRAVTFLGDTHPMFHGSVVKAIASAQRVYPDISRLLAPRMVAQVDPNEYAAFREHITRWFSAEVVEVKRHHRRVVEWVVHAPAAARMMGPGQFYRVQNYEHRTLGALQSQGLALLGVPHAENTERLSFYVREADAHSRLMQRLTPGEPLALMGPTGARTTVRLPPAATVLIIGDITSPPFLLAMAEKFRSDNHRVWYFHYLEEADDLYARTSLESVAHQIVWLTRRGCVPDARHGDVSLEGDDILQALRAFDLSAVQHVWVMGPSQLLKTIQTAQADLFNPGVTVMGAVDGPMQCMLKGVCAQCLQWQIDPATGQRTKAVYACSWQHQPLERVDIPHLADRCRQNRCQETLTNLWLELQCR